MAWRFVWITVLMMHISWGFVSHAGEQPAASVEAPTEEWQIIQLQGQRIGYTHTTSRTELREGKKIFISEVYTHMAMSRFRTKIVNNVNQITEEDEDGRLLSIYMLNDNPPTSRTETTGVRSGDTLKLETTTRKKSHITEIALPPELKSSAWIDRDLREHPLEVGQRRQFQTFEATLGKITTMTIEQLPPEETRLLSGETSRLDRTQMTLDVLPGIVTTSYSDKEGVMKKMAISLMGMEAYHCTKEEALKEIADSKIDLGIDSLVSVGIIDKSTELRQLTLKVEARDFDPRQVFLNTASQKLTAGDTGQWTLEMTAIDPGSPGNDPLPEERYLASSRYMDLQDPLIQKLAEGITPGKTDPVEIAKAAEQFVHSYLTLKNYSTALATASEVAASRSGDCTEHGVLLAALLRLKKIPARVAVGLVYVPSLKAYGGHMWTEAYLNGGWVGLDATLARGRGDALHIKTGDSALDDSSTLPIDSFLPLMHALGRMKVSVLKTEYQR